MAGTFWYGNPGTEAFGCSLSSSISSTVARLLSLAGEALLFSLFLLFSTGSTGRSKVVVRFSG
jgi:hypothetical protein